MYDFRFGSELMFVLSYFRESSGCQRTGEKTEKAARESTHVEGGPPNAAAEGAGLLVKSAAQGSAMAAATKEKTLILLIVLPAR